MQCGAAAELAAGVPYAPAVPVQKYSMAVAEAIDDEGDPAAGFTLSLNTEQWEEFQALLNEPPRDIPQLRKLLTEPGVCG